MVVKSFSDFGPKFGPDFIFLFIIEIKVTLQNFKIDCLYEKENVYKKKDRDELQSNEKQHKSLK